MTSTPVESVHPQLTGMEPMEVDTPDEPATSRSSSAGTVARPKTSGMSTSQAQAQLTGSHQRAGPKTKQCATDQQGIHAIVAYVMEHHGVSQEDWEQSQKPDYRVDPLNPPAWVVRHPPGQHLATLKGALLAEW